jgi:2-hydroxy-3-keto-5-methylthiopentenyl-1-phosphate phosphatase
VIGKFINNTLPISNDKDIKKALRDDSTWMRTRLSKIFDSVNQNNIKIVLHLREQAFLKTYCLTPINEFQAFKIRLLHNLDIRFMSELSNHLPMDQAFAFFKM